MERRKGQAPRKRQPRRASAENSASERARKIGETAKLVGVEPYVLRFWETQFPFIRPKQSRSRHRYYSPVDVATLKVVKRLLHVEGYTIAGARKFVREEGLDRLRDLLTLSRRPGSGKTKQQLLSASAASSRDRSADVTPNGLHRTLLEIREDLRELHKLLDT